MVTDCHHLWRVSDNNCFTILVHIQKSWIQPGIVDSFSHSVCQHRCYVLSRVRTMARPQQIKSINRKRTPVGLLIHGTASSELRHRNEECITQGSAYSRSNSHLRIQMQLMTSENTIHS